MNKYKKTGSVSLFSEAFRLEKLSKQGDPLERLNKVVKWEYFRETIEQLYSKKTSRCGTKAIRSSFDVQDFDFTALL
jgi:hypothetical protein